MFFEMHPYPNGDDVLADPELSQMNGSAPRYGIYFSPSPATSLHELGSRWLGRDAITGQALNPQLPAELPHGDWVRATESPRRYGFHATLKPPFRLAEGAFFEDLQTALHEFAAQREAFEAPKLTVGRLGHFLALTLAQPSGPFSRLAADSVSAFERFRSPATEQELEQRLRGSLSLREREHVIRWGYPYVFDTWKFHMSLTGSLAPEALPPLEEHLCERFAGFGLQPLLVDSVCIFYEPSPGAPFRVVDRAMLGSA